MGRLKILIYAVALFLVLITDTVGQWQPPEVISRPLCATQVTLANYACATLPYSVLPPPPPPSLLPGNNESEGSPPSHRHHHRHHHRVPLSPMERSCCKWVRQIDNECVCGLLTTLPVFLGRPQHNFTVLVGASCEVRYYCGGVART